MRTAVNIMQMDSYETMSNILEAFDDAKKTTTRKAFDKPHSRAQLKFAIYMNE